VRGRRALLSLAAALVLAALPAQAQQQQIGVVLLHGKWGTPSGPLQPFELALRGAGFKVVAPEMPWSNTRAYDQGVDGALQEIDREVAALRGAGATLIVVGGQSLGANIALAYGARHPELDGLIVLSPGHTPERMVHNPRIAESLSKAEGLVAAGKGSQIANFDDLNQGRERQVSARAADYVSFFDPAGEAVMPRSAARLSPHTALLWVVGRHDPLAPEGPSYGFDRAPRNPRSAYHTVDADHFGAPAASRQIGIDWLKGLR
jgi:pimeloyl-ACP methyl ester carboxylesterase